jgi:hypothetical protein
MESRRSRLGMKQNNASNDRDDAFDIEAARKKLESILESSDSEGLLRDKAHAKLPKPTAARSYQTFSSLLEQMSLPEAPRLTSIERERREAEIKILQSLEHSDAALSDLWTLWFQERGADAAARLVKAEQLSNHPRTWEQAEVAMLALISTYGVYWAEPVNKLATLYYMQGKMKESAALCKTVLAIKPWHFGALSGIVGVFAGLEDMEQARQWAAHRLPSLAPTGSPNKRREQWVQKAVSDAIESLLVAEKRLQDSFGQRDSDIVEGNNKYYNELDDKDSWQ